MTSTHTRHSRGAGASAPDRPVVDRTRWPDVARVPSGRVRPAVARLLFRRAVRDLPIRVLLPHGERLGAGTDADPAMQLHRPEDFYRRLGAGALIGFGESYQAGDWSSAHLAEVLTVLASHVAELVPRPLQRLRALAVAGAPSSERGTLRGARSNVARHYDLSNEMFAQFLDPTMTYSSALFEEDEAGRPLPQRGTLEQAQQRKIDRLLDLSSVGNGTSVLEIGTGWGELAIRAARRGARVRSVTLSAQQRDLATRRIADAGLSQQVDVVLQDYREVTGRYDAVLSVEMIEAVGHRFWPSFFAALDRLTAPGGRVGLQAITMPHERMMTTRNSYTWIHKYIFPGGIIPSVRAVGEQVAHTSLRLAEQRSFGLHYAQTLRLWRERFIARTKEIDSLGFDEVFDRMWEFYLAYSQAGFAARYLDVNQFLLRSQA